jgi:hypothetical protein
MTDLGPLLAAVTDDWDPAERIAERAGWPPREAREGLASLAGDGILQVFRPSWEGPIRVVTLYRRGPKAPPLVASLTAEQILDGLRGKLFAIALPAAGRDQYGEGFMACWDEISSWLDAAQGPRP